MAQPSTNGANGRQPNGRFDKGNAGGPGNPFAEKVAKIRASLMDAATDADLRAIAKKVVEMAKDGDMAAIKEFYDRTCGRAAQPITGPNGEGAVPVSISVRFVGGKDGA